MSINGEQSRGYNGYSQYAPLDKQALINSANFIVNNMKMNPKVENLHIVQDNNNINEDGIMNTNYGYNYQQQQYPQFAQTNIYNQQQYQQPTYYQQPMYNQQQYQQPMYNQQQYQQPMYQNTNMQSAITNDYSDMDGDAMCSFAMRKHITEYGNDYTMDRQLDERGNLKRSNDIKVTIDKSKIRYIEEPEEQEEEFEYDDDPIDYNCYEGYTSISSLFKNLLPKGANNTKTTSKNSFGLDKVFFTKESEQSYHEQQKEMMLDYTSNDSGFNTSLFMPKMFDFRKERQMREEYQQQCTPQQPIQMQNVVAEQYTQQPGSTAKFDNHAYSYIEKKNSLYSSNNTEKIKNKCLNIIGRYRTFGPQSGVSLEDLYAAYHTLNYGRSGLNFPNAIDDYVNQIEGKTTTYVNEAFPVQGENFVFDPEKVKNDPNRVIVPTKFTEEPEEKEYKPRSIKSLFSNLIPKKSLVSSDNFEDEEIKYDTNNHGDLNKLQEELGIEHFNQNTNSNTNLNTQIFDKFNNTGYNQIAPRYKTMYEIQQENKERMEQQKMINKLTANCMKYFGIDPNQPVKEKEVNKLTDEQVILLNEMIAMNLRKEEMDYAKFNTQVVKQKQIAYHNDIRDTFLAYFDGGEDVFDFFENAGDLYEDIQKEKEWMEEHKRKINCRRSEEEEIRIRQELGMPLPHEKVLLDAGIKLVPGMTISADGTLNVNAPDFIKKKYEARRKEYEARKEEFIKLTEAKPRELEKKRNFFRVRHKGIIDRRC